MPTRSFILECGTKNTLTSSGNFNGAIFKHLCHLFLMNLMSVSIQYRPTVRENQRLLRGKDEVNKATLQDLRIRKHSK